MRAVVVFFALLLVLQLADAKYSRFFGSQPKTFKDAMEYCEIKSHSLMIIRGGEKMREVMKQMHKRGLKNLWIGVRRDEQSNNTQPFVWKYAFNNETVETHYWMPGAPDNHKSDKMCVEMNVENYDLTNLNRWNDVNCEIKLNFFCETI